MTCSNAQTMEILPGNCPILLISQQTSQSLSYPTDGPINSKNQIGISQIFATDWTYIGTVCCKNFRTNFGW